MTALNIFGKKEAAEKKKPQKKVIEASAQEAPKQARQTDIESVEKTVKKESKGAKVSAGSQLIRAHITEKATDLAARNQYVFVVIPDASKKEIEHSVESAYGVIVRGVHIINVRPKSMRLGRTRGTKSGYKKAIVTVKDGQTIEVLPT